MSIKKVLIVTPYLPSESAGYAGSAHICEFIRELKKEGIAVYLVSLILPHEMAFKVSVASICDEARFIETEEQFFTSLGRFLNRFPLSFPRFPNLIAQYLSLRRRVMLAVEEMLLKHEPDVLQIEFSLTVLYMKRLETKKIKVLRLHDVMFKPASRLFLRETQPLARLFRFFFYLVIKWIEIRFCRQFDLLLTLSEKDRELVVQENFSNVHFYPLRTHVPEVIYHFDSREPGSILFVGAMSRKLNVQAVFYIVHEVLPRLKKHLGRVKFYIVGDSPSKAVRTLACEEIVVTGFVPDLGQYYNRCRVFVAPIFIGGGMIYKIIQAMSYGLPVASTTVGNEGVLAKDGEEILIANDADVFCKQIIRLMNDRREWEKFSVNGRAFVSSHYAWDGAINKWLEFYEKPIKHVA